MEPRISIDLFRNAYLRGLLVVSSLAVLQSYSIRNYYHHQPNREAFQSFFS